MQRYLLNTLKITHYRTLFLIWTLAVLAFLATCQFGLIPSVAYSGPPAYAKPNSYADYQLQGGYIPFFEGVNGTFDYTVLQVFGNGTMSVHLVANVSSGNELPTVSNVSNYQDMISSPRIFPAIPSADINSSKILFDNISVDFVRNVNETVPAGTFETAEYRGVGVNGSQLNFYIDRSTGLAVEMEGDGGLEQLTGSNIASPISVQSGVASSIPYVEVFALGWLLAAVAFLFVRRYYNKKGKKYGRGNHTPVPKAQGSKKR